MRRAIQVFSLVFCATTGILASTGCQAPSAGARDEYDALVGPATEGAVEGDWSDVNTSVLAAAIKMEMTVVHHQAEDRDGEAVPDPDTREYLLRSVTDTPAWVRVRRVEGPAYEISAKIGRFGDPELEQELIGWISRRMGELDGVDVRRIGWMGD